MLTNVKMLIKQFNKYNLPKIIQENMENLMGPIPISEIV